MNKKVLVAIVVVLVLVVGGALAWTAVNNVEEDSDRQSESSQQEAEQRQEEVLEEARNYQPPEGTHCTTVMTPARHIETGVTHTFPSGCLPDGWEAIDRTEANEGTSQDDNGQATPEQDQSSDDGQTTPQSNAQSSQSEEDAALREARNYQPPKGSHCTTVMTPARHIKTGVTYTFTSGCIPDGWEKIPPSSMQPNQ